MIRPTGLLARYPFVVLAHGQCCVSVQYEPQPLALPDGFGPYLETLEAYWQQESPELRDGETIVSVERVKVWMPVGNALGYILPTIELTYRPARYFQFLYANYSLEVPLPGGTTLRALYDDGRFGRFQKAPTAAVERLGDRGWLPGSETAYDFPTFGNSLGITVAIVTADRQLIVAKRSATAKGIARDKGHWSCAVGSQVQRHQPRFLNTDGIPAPGTSAYEARRDEMGATLADRCASLACLGLVYREDFHHCELIYQCHCSLSAGYALAAWRDSHVPDRREFESITAIDLSRGVLSLLGHLTDPENHWSPQHAAAALLVAAERDPEAVGIVGLDLSATAS